MSWSTTWPESKPVQGTATFPSVRYSASAVSYGGELVVTHGYFYDHQHHRPAWQSNAWAFNFARREWRRVHEGEKAGAPSARYCMSAVVFEHGMWVFGGDDGGHKHSMNNYVFGAHFDELWRLDLRTYAWRRVKPADGVAPPKRALHQAVVLGASMYVYGGLGKADLWRYDFGGGRWTQLMAAPGEEDDEAHPGVRHAFAAAPSGGDGFYVHGGTRHRKGGGRPRVFGDLWRYNVNANGWTKVRPAGGGELRPPKPGPRGHHSLLALGARKLLLYGGALCTPGCVCYGDTWAFDADRAAWSRLNATNAPIHRYRQSLVRDAETGVVYLFGGESYKPYMYHNAVDALRLPAALAAAAPAEAGAVGWAAPPQSLTAATPPAREPPPPRATAAAVAAAASLVAEPPKLWDRPAGMIGETISAPQVARGGHLGGVFAPNAMGDFLFNVFVGLVLACCALVGWIGCCWLFCCRSSQQNVWGRPSRRRFRKIGE